MKVDESRHVEKKMSRSSRKYILLGVAVVTLVYIAFRHTPGFAASCQNASNQVMICKEGGRKPTYLTSLKAISVVPSGGDRTDVRWENTDVRWVGVHPLVL
jgi:hypothetical protein